MTIVRVYMRHVRACGLCSSGSRAMAERHGIDWSKFLKEGVLSTELEHIDDDMIRQLIECARKEEGQ